MPLKLQTHPSQKGYQFYTDTLQKFQSQALKFFATFEIFHIKINQNFKFRTFPLLISFTYHKLINAPNHRKVSPKLKYI